MKTSVYTFLILAVFLLGGSTLSAQPLTEYELLSPLPVGKGGVIVNQTNAQDFIPGLFRLTIMLATGLAVLFIIWGGVQYMSTDAWGGKNDAKNTIWNAIMGLLLTLSSWLIVNTINPDLMNFNLSIERFEIPENKNAVDASPGTGAMTPEQISTDAQVRNQLDNGDVDVNAGPCTTPGQTTGCTNLNNLGQAAITGLINLRQSCNCTVVVTGGTEGGHASHGPNLPIVDVRKNSSLNTYIANNGERTNASCGLASAPKFNLNGSTYVDEGNHWHVCY